jgi:hypothetical protein
MNIVNSYTFNYVLMERTRTKILLLILGVSIIAFVLCAYKQIIKIEAFSPSLESRVLESYWPKLDWRYATPEEMGMDSSILEDMVDDINSQPPNIQVDCILIVKNGYIVFENYFNNYKENTPHSIFSCTKVWSPLYSG